MQKSAEGEFECAGKRKVNGNSDESKQWRGHESGCKEECDVLRRENETHEAQGGST